MEFAKRITSSGDADDMMTFPTKQLGECPANAGTRPCYPPDLRPGHCFFFLWLGIRVPLKVNAKARYGMA